jgi:hypothetical protein
MKEAAANPYQSPLAPAKMSDADAADIKRRDIAVFVLLCVVTLGIYWFYVSYHWSKEVNGLVGRVKYQPLVVLLVNIFTCGIAGMVFESLFAFDVAEQAKARGIKDRFDQMPTWVIVCNSAAVITALIPFGFVLAIPLGTLASVLVQIELNKLAERYGM